MKVAEKATDRRAEAHIYIDGKVHELEEFGEYVDPVDKAICCYIPVEEGYRVKIRGRFSGTTLIVAFDAVVDGIYRKASSYIAKTVNNHNHKKLDFETFLYRTDKGIIDTDMQITPLSGVTMSQGEGTETIGTMELRLYITRRIGVNHTLGNIQSYCSHKGDIEDAEDKTATYKQIEPTSRITFEQNCAPIEKHKATREQRKMESKRPGTGPWAIFRFHYRSNESIVAHDLVRTWKHRSKTEPHFLDLESVPSLPLGMKPQKDDGDNSTRTSTCVRPVEPLAPVKGSHKVPKPKFPVLSKKEPAILTTTLAPKPRMTSTNKKEIMPSTETTPVLKVADDVSESFRARVFSKPSSESTSTEVPVLTADKALVNSDSGSIIATSNINGNIRKIPHSLQEAFIMERTEKASVANTGDALTEPTKKPIKKDSIPFSNTVVATLPKDKPIGSTSDGDTKISSLSQPNFTPIKGTATDITAATKKTVKKAPEIWVPPVKKPAVNPRPLSSARPTAQKKPPAAATSVTPTKRTAEPAITTTPETKRAKVIPTPITSTKPTIISHITSGLLSLRPLTMERKLAEQRKKIETLRLKRLETAKKQETLNKQMKPYRQRMIEELERLDREMMEEEAAAAEDEEHLNASVAMLAEFEKAERGD